MSAIKPKVKVPKSASVDEIVEIKALISHPMHTGRAKDSDGNVIPRQIIHTFKASFDGQEVFSVVMEPAVSANPFVSFPFKATKSGQFDFVWMEDGGAEYTVSKKMKVA